MKKKFLASILVIMLALSCTIVYASNLDDLNNRKKIYQKNIESAEQEVKSLQIELTETLEKITKLEGQIAQNNKILEEIKSDLSITEGEIKETEKKLAVLQNDYDVQNKAFEKRVVAMYEAGESTYLDVLLGSKNVTDFVTNYYLISEMVAMDDDLLNTIEREKNQITEIKAELEGKRQILKQKEEIQQKTIITLNNAKMQRDYYAKSLTEQEKQTLDKIKQYQKEQKEIEDEIQRELAKINGNTPSYYTGGRFAWPAPGFNIISSGFGARRDPFTGNWAGHRGIDICGTWKNSINGKNIVAAESGKVAYIRTVERNGNRGYGNAVYIDHGGGIVTIYGHGSKILVRTGQFVSRGDVIMKAGTTGRSTGPHLHFEVRVRRTSCKPITVL